jgi:hypothetical protein
MAYAQSPVQDVMQLRNQGLTDQLITNELLKRGYDPSQVQMAISQLDSGYGQEMPTAPSSYGNYGGGQSSYPSSPASSNSSSGADGNIYERIQEIAETMIDEKWDELLAEVKKIVEWKEKVEEKQLKIESDVQKLKDDFNVLHQGVLGKLEDYDTRMRDVGTDLKAVGRVFKDVIPEFVENVKELSSVTERMKK